MGLEFFVHKNHAAVAKYTGEEKRVVIPDVYQELPVTEIGEAAFAGNEHIEAVAIPKTLRSIGDRAFVGCHNLRYVGSPEDEKASMVFPMMLDGVIPMVSRCYGDLERIGAYAFAQSGIRRLEFDSGELEMGDKAFEGCLALEQVSCYGCKTLKLGIAVFKGSSIRQFFAPSVKMEKLPNYTFANCGKLKKVGMPIRAVGDFAFYRCSQLLSLQVRDTLESVGENAFEGCDSLKDLSFLPGAVPEEPVVPNAAPMELDPDAVFSLFSEDEPENTGAEDADAELTGDPLLSLYINFKGRSAKPIPAKITGTFSQKNGTVFFTISTPSVLTELELRGFMDEKMERMMPIVNYIIKRDMKVALLGGKVGKRFEVLEIRPASSVTAGKDLAPDFFAQMLQRLEKPMPKGVDLGSMVAPFTMRSKEEFEGFIDICGDRLPSWVVRAYYRNKAIAGRPGKDESKHAVRAQELLANIDWLPNVLDVPPADTVRAVLDSAFFGLDTVKNRIVEVVSQIRRTGNLPKWGILLHGPAGTGKTSIAKAIAQVLNMPIIQMDMSSLGEDPDEISGSSRIYSNARPGMLIESMFHIRSSTAVLLANEVDKAGGGSGRSTADILLSILDKTGFYENFMEETIPTDNLFCIGTCNDLSKVSKPIQDRFLIINIPGYTPAEKKVIWRDYVLPKAMARAEITAEEMTLADDAVDLLVADYAVEPGARDLEQYAERFIGDYCRHADFGGREQPRRVYTVRDMKDLFGPGRTVVRSFAINPGEVNAAFYYQGRAHFFMIEASVFPGTGKFEVLGPMAKIQEEYCKVAYYCVRNTTTCDLSKYDVAIFVPQPIPEGLDNHLGMACYAAICSKLLNTHLALRDTCFIGGVDMNGSLFFDENTLTPLLRAMRDRGLSTLYAPAGTNRLVDTKAVGDCNVVIIEGADAKTLFSLAVAHEGAG